MKTIKITVYFDQEYFVEAEDEGEGLDKVWDEIQEDILSQILLETIDEDEEDDE